ncbi:OmpH family outer membrane protein [Fodinibius halophilus]|uniref:OmpH family outer membrane protein n=1 Tax=Fodinibius halophilus TaxID=1736908 RepID=A0A6M1TLI5_9BACT|nr:OmpH family outer membrane protein [Fodinibius halophilus]NGP89320.1 OmpH family outer membrane protein [Fodinibius halophilus]
MLCSAFLLMVQVATAQEQKIAYIDTDYILSQMSEYEGVQQQLETISSEWNAELEKMKEEIEQLKEDFETKKILYTEKLRKKKKEEIQNKVQQRQQFLDQKFGAKGEYFRKQKELLAPIQRKVFNAVNTVAKRKDFDFVFDRAQNSNMLYSDKEWNLNNEVLEELGITLNDSSN